MRRSGHAGAPRHEARPSRAVPLALFLLVALALTAAAGFSYGAGAADLRRQQEHELAARTIFLTGGAFTDAAAAFLERVPNPRLEKPFDRTALREIVGRVAGSPSAATVRT